MFEANCGLAFKSGLREAPAQTRKTDPSCPIGFDLRKSEAGLQQRAFTLGITHTPGRNATLHQFRHGIPQWEASHGRVLLTRTRMLEHLGSRAFVVKAPYAFQQSQCEILVRIVILQLPDQIAVSRSCDVSVPGPNTKGPCAALTNKI